MQEYELNFEDLVSQLKEAGFEINQNALDVFNIRATQIAWSQYREIANQVYQGAWHLPKCHILSPVASKLHYNKSN